MSKTPIPTLATLDAALKRFADAVKANIERVTAQNKNFQPITRLAAGATDEEMRLKINEIIERLEG